MITIGAAAGGAIAELSKTNKALDETGSSSSKMSAGLQKAAVPAAAALTAIAVASVDAAKAAAEDAAAQDKLVGVLERATGATSEQAKATDDWISSLSLATGVADDQLRPAMGKLAMATGDTAEAQKALELALDISAATGKDVVAVSTALAKGFDGTTKGIKTLVPGLDQATLKSGDMNAIMAELAETTGGAMARSADTAAGQYAIFTNQMSELKETLGAALLPVLEAILPIMNRMAELAAENTTAIQLLIAAVAAISAGILIANAAIKAYHIIMGVAKAATTAWTAVQWLLNAALSANPIGLVIVAVAALAAGIVVAWKHSETFRRIVTAAFDAVAAAGRAMADAFVWVWDKAKAAFNWIMDHWKLVAPLFGPIGVAVVVVANNFDKLKAIATACFEAIRGAIQWVVDAFHSMLSAIESVISALGRIKVPKIDLPGPFLLPPPAGAPSSRSSSGVYAAAGGLTVNVYGAVDPEGTARAIRRILGASDRRLGR
jgi:hypothetical protein